MSEPTMSDRFTWEDFDIVSVDRSSNHRNTLLRWCRQMATELGIPRVNVDDKPDAAFDARANAFMSECRAKRPIILQNAKPPRRNKKKEASVA